MAFAVASVDERRRERKKNRKKRRERQTDRQSERETHTQIEQIERTDRQPDNRQNR